MMLYHRTEDAHSLVKAGFQDTGTYTVDDGPWTGLWLCDVPFGYEDVLAKMDVVSVEIPEGVVEEFEIDLATEGRSFLVPARIVNKYPPTLVEREGFDDLQLEEYVVTDRSVDRDC